MKLTFDNYKMLMPYYELTRSLEPISPLTYAMWDYFDCEVHFEIHQDVAIIYGYYREVGRWMFMNPYCKPENYSKVISSQREVLKKQTNKNIESILLYGANAYYHDLKRDTYKLNTNYIYNLEAISTFQGSALQKKRNNFNYFARNYGEQVEIIKLTYEILLDYREKIDAFLVNSVEERIGEKRFLKQFLDIFATDSFSGILMILDGKIIGITIGYLHGDYYEIFVEKSLKEIRGSYQYLLAKNIEINEIKCKYMDRQDDANTEGIKISKESYRPIKVIERLEMKWKNL